MKRLPFAFLLVAFLSASLAAADKPNLVFILADDMEYDMGGFVAKLKTEDTDPLRIAVAVAESDVTVDPGSDKRYLQNLRDLKSRRTTSEQKIVIVFEAQWMPDYGKAGYQKEAMAELAERYYRLANSDPDVIGMVGFAWPGGLGGPDRFGARNLPESVKAEHRRIGLAITGKPASPGK